MERRTDGADDFDDAHFQDAHFHDAQHPLTHEEYLAAYVAGELDSSTYEEVDRHLMHCESCWHDLRLARAGRAAAVEAIEPVPEELRRGLVSLFAELRPIATVTVTSAPPRVPWHRGSRRVLPVLAVAAAIAAAFIAGVGFSGPDQPPISRPGRSAASPNQPATIPGPASDGSVLSLALDGYRSATLPGTGVPLHAAPDLSELGLHLMAASAGRLAGQPVSVYAYEDPTTRIQLFVYVSAEQFKELAPPPGAATAMEQIDAITVFTDTTHPMLVVGRDKNIVESVGDRLT